MSLKSDQLERGFSIYVLEKLWGVTAIEIVNDLYTRSIPRGHNGSVGNFTLIMCKVYICTSIFCQDLHSRNVN